jgi:hypothetical protein
MSIKFFCSNGLTRAEAGASEGHEGAVYGRGSRKYPTWYIDTTGSYHWQILEKTSDTEMEVLLRALTPKMTALGCNGCSAHHVSSQNHCSANNPENLSDAQQDFADVWKKSDDTSVFCLYEIGKNRTRYPGNWKLDFVSGIFEDGYVSGQATVKLVSF